MQERTAENMVFDDDGELVFAGKKKVDTYPDAILTFPNGDVVYAEKFVSHLKQCGVRVRASYRKGDGSLNYMLGGDYVGIGKYQDADKGEGTPA